MSVTRQEGVLWSEACFKCRRGKELIRPFYVLFVRSNGSPKAETNPFEEEEWDEDVNDALVDNGEPGVPVRALYDYEGAEADELSFRQGRVK